MGKERLEAEEADIKRMEQQGMDKKDVSLTDIISLWYVQTDTKHECVSTRLIYFPVSFGSPSLHRREPSGVYACQIFSRLPAATSVYVSFTTCMSLVSLRDSANSHELPG